MIIESWLGSATAARIAELRDDELFDISKNDIESTSVFYPLFLLNLKLKLLL